MGRPFTMLLLAAALAATGCLTGPDQFDPERGQPQPLELGREVFVQVDAAGQWQSTGVHVQRGQRLRVEATGIVDMNEQFFPNIGPDGVNLDHSIIYDHWLHGALLGRIGRQGPPFLVGSRLEWTAGQTGTLYMRVNDSRPYDNKGHFQVRILSVPKATPASAPAGKTPE